MRVPWVVLVTCWIQTTTALCVASVATRGVGSVLALHIPALHWSRVTAEPQELVAPSNRAACTLYPSFDTSVCQAAKALPASSTATSAVPWSPAPTGAPHDVMRAAPPQPPPGV
jgi:hypothetical protein